MGCFKVLTATADINHNRHIQPATRNARERGQGSSIGRKTAKPAGWRVSVVAGMRLDMALLNDGVVMVSVAVIEIVIAYNHRAAVCLMSYSRLDVIVGEVA